MHYVYLLLGSNLGERLLLLQKASEQITLSVGKIETRSSIYETAPWGVSDQPNYLNQILGVRTALSAEKVLDIILTIEEGLGRIREEKWSSRLIDIDILFYDNNIVNTERLQIPHPLLHLRKFVLFPLAEIAPDFQHPLLKLTITELLANAKGDALEVKKYICE